MNIIKKIKRFPLIEWNITEKDALQYCYSKGFDWDGLYEEGHRRVSCYLCPLQDLNSLFLVYKNHKDLWSKMKELDKYSCKPFTKRYTLEQLEDKFNKKLNSLSLLTK